MKKTIFIGLLTLSLMQVSQMTNASLITNGSFEIGLTGWNTIPFSGGSISTSGTEGVTDGVQAVIFNGGNLLGGTLSQSFATIIGTEYQLTFDYGVFSTSFPSRIQSIQLEILGFNSLLNTTVTDSASSPTSFKNLSFNFVADSLSTTLNFNDFTSLGESFAIDGIIDSVNITAVPIPAAGWLFGTGLLALISFRNNRSKIFK